MGEPNEEGCACMADTKLYYQGCEVFVQDKIKKTIYMNKNISVKVHTRIFVVLEVAIPLGINK